ncbi:MULTISPECIES: NAD(P)/FAD-dependent oxidoreductase [unclassified Mucilaginibacter]|uniref:NAD(P)/FAD-dependent oxidoreductase n=1 Tax=unclassified Mucilaginibacter TaxID=2617802 RepID=UPI002AC8A5FF|nr:MULTISPECIES: NAD(P)/FAD-dependent oxidoreductase [unclassified Mucilaginibacter]MEB0260808.1 NAD(P)/FAD-dependent oxidoreductase [Mucilaginibacter sp. 10I4]MEB0279023.1 NAD(P)/FAD-dependent oxidoreductase [Mucilaginibacter sp. 10B2]MEB0299958.1 NAD(P)/FAD-dependent oxidoreductase [Mucilaginibacter sp. 5C4]WPX22201.1 NAD(P)/FAD-dependent oxidoreductase [Mucilaginibacter sp. 5C4]
MDKQTSAMPRVIIIGGGFGGVQLAKKLKHAPVEVLLLDKHNYHTFQPLLYQVATGAIEGDSIGFPIRRIFNKQKNFTFHLAEVQSIDTEKQIVTANIGDLKYDYLVIATGANTNYFGNKELERNTMPMKNVAEALNIRSLILQNLEKALVTTDKIERDALLTFVIVGGGPTGVELAGSISELRKFILCKDYPGLCNADMKVFLVEGKAELLAAMSPQASIKAKKFLTDMDITIFNSVHVESYNGMLLKIDDGTTINTRNVFWAAGVRGEVPTGMPEESVMKGGRLITNGINRVKGFTNVFAIGDVSAVITEKNPVGFPGVAQVALQQGKQLAKNIINLVNDKPTIAFTYADLGTMATIGRNKAVVDLHKLRFHGFFAWLLWMFVHLMSLAGFSNKAIVFFNWAVNYLTRNSDNRLIIHYFKTDTMTMDPVAR